MMFIFDDFVLYIEKQSYTVQTHLLWMTLGKDGDYLNVKDCHLSLNRYSHLVLPNRVVICGFLISIS